MNEYNFGEGMFCETRDIALLVSTALRNIELERQVRFENAIKNELEKEQKKANKKRWFRKPYVPKTKEQLIEHYKTFVYNKDDSWSLPYTLYMKCAGNYYTLIESKFRDVLKMCQVFPQNKEIFISSEFFGILMDWQKKPVDSK